MTDVSTHAANGVSLPRHIARTKAVSGSCTPAVAAVLVCSQRSDATSVLEQCTSLNADADACVGYLAPQPGRAPAALLARFLNRVVVVLLLQDVQAVAHLHDLPADPAVPWLSQDLLAVLQEQFTPPLIAMVASAAAVPQQDQALQACRCLPATVLGTRHTRRSAMWASEASAWHGFLLRALVHTASCAVPMVWATSRAIAGDAVLALSPRRVSLAVDAAVGPSDLLSWRRALALTALDLNLLALRQGAWGAERIAAADIIPLARLRLHGFLPDVLAVCGVLPLRRLDALALCIVRTTGQSDPAAALARDVLPAAPRLSALLIDALISVPAALPLLRRIAALPLLTELVLRVRVGNAGTVPAAMVRALQRGVWPRLCRLRHLDLSMWSALPAPALITGVSSMMQRDCMRALSLSHALLQATGRTSRPDWREALVTMLRRHGRGLRDLDLSYTAGLSELQWHAVLHALPVLQHLVLRDAGVPLSVLATALPPIAASLLQLDVRGARMSLVGDGQSDKLTSALAGCAHLRVLRLSWGNGTAAALATLATGLRHLAALTDLELVNMPFSSSAARHLADSLTQLPRLHTLLLPGCFVDTTAHAWITALQPALAQMPLHVLGLASADVHAVSLQALADAGAWPQLRVLDLNQGISSNVDCADALGAWLKQLPRLVKLDVVGCLPGPVIRAIAAASASLPLQDLSVPGFAETGQDEDDAVAWRMLAQLRHLRRVHVSGWLRRSSVIDDVRMGAFLASLPVLQSVKLSWGSITVIPEHAWAEEAEFVVDLSDNRRVLRDAPRTPQLEHTDPPDPAMLQSPTRSLLDTAALALLNAPGPVLATAERLAASLPPALTLRALRHRMRQCWRCRRWKMPQQLRQVYCLGVRRAELRPRILLPPRAMRMDYHDDSGEYVTLAVRLCSADGTCGLL